MTKGRMVFARFLLIPIILALGVTPALAKPTVIAELGAAPLLGPSSSTAQMRARVAANQVFVAAAARKLGLSAKEYAHFNAAIASSQVAWVTVPRHLDGMSWRSGNRVHVLHDVIIPAGTHGWEVDVRSGNERLAVYMPAACGNVSVVRTIVPAVAYHRAPPPVIVAPAPPVVAVTNVEPAVVVPDDTPAPPVQVAQTEFPPVAAAHHSALFLAPLLFGLAAFSGGSGPGPIVAPPAGCP